ncbi:MAG: type IV pilus biogenesis/stability protein PilW [Rhodocyclaceae bacterium]|nr:type IV pilus biogenesis/stability protein PilW [Rhodocyclaceae bacterium]
MRFWSLCLLAALSACAGAPSSGLRGGSSEQAVSQQTSTTDAQQRAKIHTELGSLYLQDQRFGVALEEGRIAISADSAYAPGYNLLGLVHMYLQEQSAAEENFLKALRLAPGDPEINNNYGWFLCQSDREQQSVNYFLNAIKNPLYTTPAKPLTNLGLCYLKMKDDRLGEDFLFKALRADPGNIQALYWLSDIYYRKGRYSEARLSIGDLHKMMDPNSQSLWLALRVERKIGDREGEARFASQLRRKFQGSPEYQKLMQGQYE